MAKSINDKWRETADWRRNFRFGVGQTKKGGAFYELTATCKTKKTFSFYKWQAAYNFSQKLRKKGCKVSNIRKTFDDGGF